MLFQTLKNQPDSNSLITSVNNSRSTAEQYLDKVVEAFMEGGYEKATQKKILSQLHKEILQQKRTGIT